MIVIRNLVDDLNLCARAAGASAFADILVSEHKVRVAQARMKMGKCVCMCVCGGMANGSAAAIFVEFDVLHKRVSRRGIFENHIFDYYHIYQRQPMVVWGQMCGCGGGLLPRKKLPKRL